MTTDELFLLTLSVQDRNGVNYFMRVYNVSVQEAYKILKGEIAPPRINETPAAVHETPAAVHETPAAVHETPAAVHETAKAVPPPADPAKHEPVTRKEYQCKYCGKKYRLSSHNRSMLYCYFCIKENLHYLHMQFGSTNGWDKKPKAPRAPIEPGWRGRVVIAPGPRTLSLQPCNPANPV